MTEGLDTKENPDDQVRNKLNAWMEQDQQFTDPTQRASFQSKVWPYIQKNIQSILSDKGEKGNGDYPAAPYAAWLLVQHMDAYPQNQIEFYNALKQAIPDHPKIQFLRDRAAVNRWILKLNDPKKYIDKHGKPLTNPTADVRDPSKFDDAGIEYTSAADALKGAISAGNTLLVDAVKKSRATTQPSYKQGVAEGTDPWGSQGRFVGDTGPTQITTTVPRVQLRIGDRVVYKPTEQRATIEALSKDGTKARIHISSPMGGRTFNCRTADLKALGALKEKSTSQAQFRTMAAAAHDPKFARKVGIKQSVAREFNRADKGQSYKSLPKRAD
jgi:hypothetical protein